MNAGRDIANEEIILKATKPKSRPRVQLKYIVETMSSEDELYVARKLNLAKVFVLEEHCLRQKHMFCLEKDKCACWCHLPKEEINGSSQY